MKILEVLTEATTVGREFQHLEDLLIVDGAAGGIEALEELADASSSPSSLGFKWDGGAAVYWGRNNKGEFVFVPKNQWGKEQMLDKEGLSYQIKSTGKIKSGQSPEAFAKVRAGMAAKYEELWDLFEEATPSQFKGYLTGDLMFTEPQRANPRTGEYEFTPNKVTYHVRPTGLGGKMATAKAFVIVHGKIAKFGADATGNLTPMPDNIIEQFNKTSRLIVLNSQKPKIKLKPNTKELNQAINFIKTNAAAINEIADYTAPKFSSLKSILYTYAVARAKAAGVTDFAAWLNNSKVSDNQKAILQNDVMRKPSWQVFWAAFHQILNAKHAVLEQLHTMGGNDMYDRLGIRASTGGKPGGEGFVKTFKSGKLGKLVNPEFRSAPTNPLFLPDAG
jgi:hypothetical protein